MAGLGWVTPPQAYNKQSNLSDRCKWSPVLNKRNNISIFTKPLNFIMYCLERKNASITLIWLFIISWLPCDSGDLLIFRLIKMRHICTDYTRYHIDTHPISKVLQWLPRYTGLWAGWGLGHMLQSWGRFFLCPWHYVCVLSAKKFHQTWPVESLKKNSSDMNCGMSRKKLQLPLK